MQERRHRPATAAEFHRLADLAHQRGLRLFRDGPRWYCTSASRPGESYFLTGFSCTCPGFIAHQRCSHHALLLERLGWLPEIEDDDPMLHYWASYPVDDVVDELPELPESLTPADCPDCTGCGVVVYRSFEERCPQCGGSGVRPNHHLHDAPPAPMVAAA
jgi:hypothetical protein